MTEKERNEGPDETQGRPEKRLIKGGDKGRYWVLKGRLGCFYTCARFHDIRYTALCVFDSREAAAEHLEGLDENQLFMSTLEIYGPSMPACVRRGPLMPELRAVSGRELWEIIETVGVAYVTVNPPSAGSSTGRQTKTFELRPSEAFKVA